MRRSGFTFIEVLVVIALVGVMAICAIAPVVHMVSNIRDAQSLWGERSAVEDGARMIFRDMRSYVQGPDQTYCILRHKDLFGGKADDVLAIATGSLLRTSMMPGTVVYRVVRNDSLGMRSNLVGLYRWTFLGKRPDDLDLNSSFASENGALVLPYVDSFRVEIYAGKDWLGDYSGSMPIGARIAIEREGETYEISDWFPSL